MPKIFVIAGHGAGDPGACGNGYTEAERVRTLASRIKALGGDSVLLGDMSRDYYADDGISSLNISKEYEIVELHMDAGREDAKGGHVIIKEGFTPDAYDNALADMLEDILPGRANKIVARNNLANVDSAAARGYGYRLVEFGFITNAGDIKIFNTRMDDIARGLLGAFGIGAIKNIAKGEEEMFEILKVKGESAHYYFDGGRLHPCASQKELDMIMKAYKRNTGKDIKIHEYSNKADFLALKSLLARTEK